MVDTMDSKSIAFAGVRVRVSLAAPEFCELERIKDRAIAEDRERNYLFFDNQ